MVNITFQNGDPAWFVMYSEFQFDPFRMVTQPGLLYTVSSSLTLSEW